MSPSPGKQKRRGKRGKGSKTSGDKISEEGSPSKRELLEESADENAQIAASERPSANEDAAPAPAPSPPSPQGAYANAHLERRSNHGTPFGSPSISAPAPPSPQGAYAYADLERRSNRGTPSGSPSISPLRLGLSDLNLDSQAPQQDQEEEYEQDLEYQHSLLDWRVRRLSMSWFNLFRRLQSSAWNRICHQMFPREDIDPFEKLEMFHNVMTYVDSVLQSFRDILLDEDLLDVMKELRSRENILKYHLTEIKAILLVYDRALRKGEFSYKSDHRGRYGPKQPLETIETQHELNEFHQFVIQVLFMLVHLTTFLFYGEEGEDEERDRKNKIEEALRHIDHAMAECAAVAHQFDAYMDSGQEATTIVSTPDENVRPRRREAPQQTDTVQRRRVSFGDDHRVKFYRIRDESIDFKKPFTYNFPDDDIDEESEFSFASVDDLQRGMLGYQTQSEAIQENIRERVHSMLERESVSQQNSQPVPDRTLEQRIEFFQAQRPKKEPSRKKLMAKSEFMRSISADLPDERTVLMPSPERPRRRSRSSSRIEENDPEPEWLANVDEDEEDDEEYFGERRNADNHNISYWGRMQSLISNRKSKQNEAMLEIPIKRYRRSG